MPGACWGSCGAAPLDSLPESGSNRIARAGSGLSCISAPAGGGWLRKGFARPPFPMGRLRGWQNRRRDARRARRARPGRRPSARCTRVGCRGSAGARTARSLAYANEIHPPPARLERGAAPSVHDLPFDQVDRGLADEARDEEIARIAVDGLRLADLPHLSRAHDRDPVAEGERLLLIVRHVDRRSARQAVEARQLLAQLLPELGVEASRAARRRGRSWGDARARVRRRRAGARPPRARAAVSRGSA